MLSVVLGFTTNCCFLHYHDAPILPSRFVTVSGGSSMKLKLKLKLKLKFLHSKLNYIPRASSSEGVPTELVEDSKFVPLNAEDPRYGPPALLLLGFEADEASKIQQFLKDLDGEFLKVIYCTEDMIRHSLWEAVHTTQDSLEGVKIAESLPRICFLSGLSGEEMMMFIDAFPESGLKPAAFAALVPNSANKPLEELIEEITGDHEMLTGEQL